jgi:hypothetical protein
VSIAVPHPRVAANPCRQITTHGSSIEARIESAGVSQRGLCSWVKALAALDHSGFGLDQACAQGVVGTYAGRNLRARASLCHT